MKSLIVGPGAIGSLTCAHLQSFSDVSVFAHRNNLRLAQTINIAGLKTPLKWQIATSKTTPIDLIWACCKANHLFHSVAPLLEQHPNAIAILLNNGMGPQQQLSQKFGDRVIWGSTTCGALLQSETEYEQTSFGQTELGLNSAIANHKKLTQHLFQKNNNSGPLKLKLADNIELSLWRKLLVNACINPITAYEQIPNGQILNDRYTESITAICNEINQLLEALALQPIINGPDIVLDVARISAQNWSSMAVDVKNDRTTEIDFINGFAIEQATRLGVQVPELIKWYKRIAQKKECCQSSQ